MENRERFDWAIAVMNIQPAHHILEIGCGVGMAVLQITPLLTSGTVTAIDRSLPAIEKAVKRNAAGVACNKAVFSATDLLQFPAGGKKYDTVFSFNVNLFWTKGAVREEASIIKAVLKKSGTLYLFYGPVFADGFEKITGPVPANMEREGFTVTDTLYNKQLNCCCFIVQPG
jgi:SAM-dependent methyltransferase